jgi:hypothetical protein
MKTYITPTNRNNPKHAKPEKKSSGMLRFFSGVMLLLMTLSSFGRIAMANHRTSPGGHTPTQQTYSSSSGLTAARVLDFHREDRGSSLCEDLVVTAVGDAIYSTCGNGVEKQYALNETERQQLQIWIKNYQAVNFDRGTDSQPDSAVTQK